eukprot:gene7426-13185_t
MILKSKVMVSEKDVTAEVVIKVNGSVLGQVKKFQYLGVTLTENMASEVEVKRGIERATRALARLGNIWKARKLNIGRNEYNGDKYTCLWL